MIRFFLISCFSLLLGVASGQMTRFDVETGTRTPLVNQPFKVSFILTNGSGKGFEAPQFTGVKVIGGPSTSRSTTIVNGKRSSTSSWTYEVMATQEGRCIIGEARVKVGKAIYRTDEVILDAQKPRAGSKSQEPLMVKALLDTSTYYRGDQVTISYKLLARKSVNGVSVLSEDDYLGMEPIVTDRQFAQQVEEIDGVEYNTLILRQVRLTPSKLGRYELDPIILRLQVPDGSRSSFFRRSTAYTVTSQPISFTMIDLPIQEEVAVGRFTVSLRADNQRIRLSDALQLTVQVRGQGNLDLLGAPDMMGLEAFDVFDPDVVEKSDEYVNGIIRSSREYVYALVPKQAGVSRVQARIRYFDRDSARVVSRSSGAVSIQVRDDLAQSGTSLSDYRAQGDTVSLAAIPVGRLYKRDYSFFGSWIFYLLWALALSPIVYAIVRRRRDDAWNQLDPAERARLRAWKRASKHFEELEQSQSTLSAREFLQLAGQSYESYLCNRLQIAPADFTLDIVTSKLRDAGLSDQLLKETSEAIDRSRRARFAPVDPNLETSELFAEIKTLVGSIEQSLSQQET